MKFELIGKQKAKLVNVNVQALKLGQTELKPAVTLRFKLTAANTILNQLDAALRPFLFEKNGNAAKTQQTLDGVPPVADLPQLTQAAEKLGDFDWNDEQTGCTLIVYQGVTGSADIKLKDGTVDKLKISTHEGGAVDVFFNFYAADLDAETMGDLAVLHQHDVDIELTAPEILAQQKSLEDADDDAGNEDAGDDRGEHTPEEGLAAALGAGQGEGSEQPTDQPNPSAAWPFPTSGHSDDKPQPTVTKKKSRAAAAAS